LMFFQEPDTERDSLSSSGASLLGQHGGVNGCQSIIHEATAPCHNGASGAGNGRLELTDGDFFASFVEDFEKFHEMSYF
jgi:hypothetical protein